MCKFWRSFIFSLVSLKRKNTKKDPLDNSPDEDSHWEIHHVPDKIIPNKHLLFARQPVLWKLLLFHLILPSLNHIPLYKLPMNFHFRWKKTVNASWFRCKITPKILVIIVHFFLLLFNETFFYLYICQSDKFERYWIYSFVEECQIFRCQW